MYVLLADMQTLLGSTADTAAMQQAIDQAEALFDRLCGSETGLVSSAKTEYHASDDQAKPYAIRNAAFDLRTYGPTALTKINGQTPASLGLQYAIRGNRLTLSAAAPAPTAFPYDYAIEYTSGFPTVPNDVKAAVLNIAASLYNGRNAQGIQSFRQDLLQVNYESSDVLKAFMAPDEYGFVISTARAYQVPITLS